MPDPLERLLERLEEVTPTRKGGYKALCPGHDDHTPSLEIDVVQDGKILVLCRVCGADATPGILERIGLTVRDLFPDDTVPDTGPARATAPRVTATYDYCDGAGVLRYQVVRFEPKGFRQRRPVGDGRWEWNLAGVPRVLFRLPQLLAAPRDRVVWICEGEKDVLALEGLGLVATTNAQGAGKWKSEYSEDLRGRRVVILPDNDQPGRDHARAVAKSLADIATSVKIVELPGLPEKGDVSDWLAAGGTRAQLEELAQAAKPVAEHVFPEPIPAPELQRSSTHGQWLWHGFLSPGSVTLFSALWKSGKTTLLSRLAKALEADGEFCGLPIRAGRVLFVTEEPETRWADRRDQLGLGANAHFMIRPFRSKPGMPHWLSFLDHVAAKVKAVGYDLVAFDTLANLWPVKDENDAAIVQEALMPLHGLPTSASILLVHHVRKSDGQEATAGRGSGALPAFADTIVELRRYAAGDRQDRRRVLTGYGRWDETPQELVIELTDGGYVAHGEKRDVQVADLSTVIGAVLPKFPPGFSLGEIVEAWPGDHAPKSERLTAALNRGAESGRWIKDGEGKRGSPYRFWLPPDVPEVVSIPIPSPLGSGNGNGNGHANGHAREEPF